MTVIPARYMLKLRTEALLDPSNFSRVAFPCPFLKLKLTSRIERIKKIMFVINLGLNDKRQQEIFHKLFVKFPAFLKPRWENLELTISSTHKHR